jgi:hypothetical protein
MILGRDGIYYRSRQEVSAGLLSTTRLRGETLSESTTLTLAM